MKFITKPLRQQRVLSIPGIGNLRDLGGYPAAGGRTTRWKVILRSAGLEHLLKDGQRKLLEYGLRTDIDLRAHYQRDAAPDVFQGSAEVAYRPLPIFDAQHFEDRLDELPSTIDGYWLMLVERASAFRAVMEEVVAAEDGVTLIHCAAGKDRTGLVCALLLGLAGTPDEVIVEDYSLSQKLLTDPADEFRQQALARGYEPEEYDAMMDADPATMRAILAKFKAQYGGIPGYLSAIGMSEATLTRLRDRLVDGHRG